MPDIDQMAKDLEAIKKVLEIAGIELDWTSPEGAARLLGISRSTIVREIHAAEEKRILKRKTDLVYGVDYRKVGHNWQVHWPRFKKAVLDTPPDKRL